MSVEAMILLKISIVKKLINQLDNPEIYFGIRGFNVMGDSKLTF